MYGVSCHRWPVWVISSPTAVARSLWLSRARILSWSVLKTRMDRAAEASAASRTNLDTHTTCSMTLHHSMLWYMPDGPESTPQMAVELTRHQRLQGVCPCCFSLPGSRAQTTIQVLSPSNSRARHQFAARLMSRKPLRAENSRESPNRDRVGCGVLLPLHTLQLHIHIPRPRQRCSGGHQHIFAPRSELPGST